MASPLTPVGTTSVTPTLRLVGSTGNSNGVPPVPQEADDDEYVWIADPVGFSERLTTALSKCGCTLTAVAQAVEVRGSQIRRWQKARARPWRIRRRTLELIAGALSVGVKDLLSPSANTHGPLAEFLKIALDQLDREEILAGVLARLLRAYLLGEITLQASGSVAGDIQEERLDLLRASTLWIDDLKPWLQRMLSAAERETD